MARKANIHGCAYVSRGTFPSLVCLNLGQKLIKTKVYLLLFWIQLSLYGVCLPAYDTMGGFHGAEFPSESDLLKVFLALKPGIAFSLLRHSLKRTVLAARVAYDGIAVKSTGCSSTGPRFNSQHLPGKSQSSVNPVLQGSDALFCPLWVLLHTCAPTPTHIEVNLKPKSKTAFLLSVKIVFKYSLGIHCL